MVVPTNRSAVQSGMTILLVVVGVLVADFLIGTCLGQFLRAAAAGDGE